MKILDFPFCCTAKIVMDFGDSFTSEGTSSAVPEESIKKFINKQFLSPYNKDKAMLTAITNDEQTNGNKALKALGFEHSAWMVKNQHSDTKVRLWWKSIQKHLLEVYQKENSEKIKRHQVFLSKLEKG